MKQALKSRTIWTGLLTIATSAPAAIVTVWGLLGPEEMELLRWFFGPTTMTLLGIAIIVLRVITREPLAPIAKDPDR